MAETINYSEFDEYIRHGEPSQREKAEAWKTAIGLQAVDGLKPSQHLYATAQRNIRWKEFAPKKYRTSTEQAPNKHRTSTEQVPNKFWPSTEQVAQLISAIGNDELTVKEMLERLQLKHRPHFLEFYLTPAIASGWVRMLYPDSPRHPRQKYLLTVKGLMAISNV